MQRCQHQQLLLQNQLTENTRSLTTRILQSTPRLADAVLLCLLVKMGKSSLYFTSAHYSSFSCVCFLPFSFLFHEGKYTEPQFLWIFHYQNELMKPESDEQRKANPSGMYKGSKEKEKRTEMENTPLLTEISRTSQKFGDYSSGSLQQSYT